MGAKRVSNQILDDVLYQINEFGFYLQEFVISLHLHKRIFFEIPWRSNFLGQLTCTICLNFLLSPPAPKQCCTFVYTLPCPKSVCSSQHCLEGGEEGNWLYPSGQRSAYDATSAYLIRYGCGRKVFKDFCPPLQASVRFSSSPVYVNLMFSLTSFLGFASGFSNSFLVIAVTD